MEPPKRTVKPEIDTEQSSSKTRRPSDMSTSSCERFCGDQLNQHVAEVQDNDISLLILI